MLLSILVYKKQFFLPKTASLEKIVWCNSVAYGSNAIISGEAIRIFY
jgi:hypothetical protein